MTNTLGLNNQIIDVGDWVCVGISQEMFLVLSIDSNGLMCNLKIPGYQAYFKVTAKYLKVARKFDAK